MPHGVVLADSDYSTHNINFFNALLNARESPRGDYQQEDTGIHEAMHFIPYLSGWNQLGEMAHQQPFEHAVEQLLGPKPSE